MVSSTFLPSRFSEVYDFRLLRRLYTRLLVVAERLQNGWQQPRCRAEELLVRAVLDQAIFEGLGDGETECFRDLRDAASKISTTRSCSTRSSTGSTTQIPTRGLSSEPGRCIHQTGSSRSATMNRSTRWPAMRHDRRTEGVLI